MVSCSVQPIDTTQPTGFNQHESYGSNFQESYSSNFTAQPMDPYNSGFNQLAQPTFQTMDPFSSNFMVPTVSQSMDPFSSNFNESFGSNFNQLAQPMDSFGSNFNQLAQPMDSFGSNFTVQPMESFGSNFTVGCSPQPTPSSSYMDMLGDSNYITITQPQVRWI